jgi:hypothetical protein
MVLLIAIGAAVAAYNSSNNGKPGGNNDSSGTATTSTNIPLDPLILRDKRSVDLLPLERTLALLEAPIATITFCEREKSDMIKNDDDENQDIVEYLQARVTEIVAKNPWLGGWLARDPTTRAVKLYYDETGEQINGPIFRAFPSEIGLSRDTPYEQYGSLFEGHDVLVQGNAEIINCDRQPLWRVSVVPDQNSPRDRLALVVSMSHIVGDGFTYFRILNMLGNHAPIEAMNPVRRPHQFNEQLAQFVGLDEAYYIDKISKSPLWAVFVKTQDDTIIQRRAFFLNEEWIEGQKRAWDQAVKLEQAYELYGTGNDGERSIEQHLQSTAIAPRSNDNFKVSFAAHQASSSLTTNDIITSWFFKTANVTAGLMPYNLRNKFPDLKESDAGNYTTTIPFGVADYGSPLLIQKSRHLGKRTNANIPLPQHALDNRYGIAVDWRSFQRKGGLTMGSNKRWRQVLQLPCYKIHDLNSIPKSFSSIHLFNAGPHGEPAFTVIAPRNIMDAIASSGMVKSTIVELNCQGTEKDAFAENVQETLDGRRKSVYAPLLDGTDLSVILEDS